jgi:pimeloyl-CoA synthetase
MKKLKQISLLILLVLISINTIGQTIKIRRTTRGVNNKICTSQNKAYNGAYNSTKSVTYKTPKVKTYKNSYGEKVLSPTKTPISVPTSINNDGTYSYSKHRKGTSSHHKGVNGWY